MATNIRLTGAQTSTREESDIRINTNNLNQIVCASTKLGGTQPMSFSTDGGATWGQASLPQFAGDARQGDPTIDWTSDGTAWTVTIGIITTTDLVMRTFKSTDQGATWTFDSTVTGTQSNMDKQALWIDHSATSPHTDNMYLIWHNNNPCFVSTRKGPSGAWSAPLQISGSETTGTAIGGDIKTNANGDVFAFWPDTGSQSLFVSKSTDGGATFGTPVSIAKTNGAFQNFVPAQNGRGCLISISGGAFVTAGHSYVYALWSDLAGGTGCNSSANAPGSDVTSNCKTRVFFSRSTNGGATWSTPVKLNDQNSKNDQIFSRLAVDQVTGVLVAIYYDTINDPGRLKTDLWMQASLDHGASWSSAGRITTAQTDETSAGAQSNFQYGDYIGLTGHDGNFFACWTDRRSGGVEEIWGAPIQTSSISFVFGQSTYAKDEVSVTAAFSPAYWIQVSGFSNDQLNLHSLSDLHNNPSPAPTVSISLDPSLNTGLTVAQISAISASLSSIATSFGPLPIVQTDSTFQQDPQTFMYPFSVTFNDENIFGPLGPDQTVTLTLSASFTVGPITRTAFATLLLTSGENPRFENIDLNHPADYPSWLSFDLRFLKITVPSTGAISTASRFGATMSRNRSDAPAFIASVIANLTAGKGTVGGDSFDPGLTQDEDTSALEFLPQDNAGNFVFNFAVARVRLLGNTPGAQAKKVRVFFRLFQAQTTASNFSPGTTYRFQSDGVLNGVTVPLLGIQNDANGNPEYVTVPCFATPRVNLGGPADMKTQPEDTPNAYTIDVNPGVEVESFFGCYLDINQPDQKLFPATPPAGNPDGPFPGTLLSLSEVIARAPHQCLIAEIRYDDTPIPLGADSGSTDKLAQRNIAWIDGPNPGQVESRRMPHPFDIKASNPETSAPDELLIFWGNAPAQSGAKVCQGLRDHAPRQRGLPDAPVDADRRPHDPLSGGWRHHHSHSAGNRAQRRSAVDRIAAGHTEGGTVRHRRAPGDCGSRDVAPRAAAAQGDQGRLDRAACDDFRLEKGDRRVPDRDRNHHEGADSAFGGAAPLLAALDSKIDPREEPLVPRVQALHRTDRGPGQRIWRRSRQNPTIANRRRSGLADPRQRRARRRTGPRSRGPRRIRTAGGSPLHRQGQRRYLRSVRRLRGLHPPHGARPRARLPRP
jgi:hypothetical protein